MFKIAHGLSVPRYIQVFVTFSSNIIQCLLNKGRQHLPVWHFCTSCPALWYNNSITDSTSSPTYPADVRFVQSHLANGRFKHLARVSTWSVLPETTKMIHQFKACYCSISILISYQTLTAYLCLYYDDYYLCMVSLSCKYHLWYNCWLRINIYKFDFELKCRYSLLTKI